MQRLIPRPWMPALGLCLALSACGGLPHYDKPPQALQNLGAYDWRRHFDNGLALLESDRLEQHKLVFARAAFSNAARFGRDHAPSYAGLGLSEMELGDFAGAQIAFMDAALIDNRSMYWALSALAALRNDDEQVARNLFDAMQSAAQQDDDPVSRFIRAVYLPGDATYALPLSPVLMKPGNPDVKGDLACTADNEGKEAQCRNLDVTAQVYFVRRYVSDAVTRGNGFFNNLKMLLGASEDSNYFQYHRTLNEDGSLSRVKELLLQPHLSIPDIEYALRLTPMNNSNHIYLNAAPSVVATVGKESEVREGDDLTIMFAGGQNSNATEHTAKTGTILSMQPDAISPDSVSMKIAFELSMVSSLEPGTNSQVLDVSTNKYTIYGHFPYGQPVVLGTITDGSQSYTGSGQSGLRRVPGIGGAFGQSSRQTATSETLVLGVLSEPAAFRGSHEKRVLEAMQAMGVTTKDYTSIRRRKILHNAPDMDMLLTGFLKAERKKLRDRGGPDLARHSSAGWEPVPAVH
jgi:tetratricopeptide (TPR) repeat protein